jgi:arginyl-tRNA synthetase
MAGIFRNAEVTPDQIGPDFGDPAVLTEDVEQTLLQCLADYPGIVQRAADALEPHRIIAYLEDLARAANGWYHHHRVLGEPEPIEQARLMLARAVQLVLANALGLMGISAPERM